MGWDYIIVGAGSAGCALAWQLARSRGQSRILVLESGGPDRSAYIKVPLGQIRAISRYDWGYRSEPDPTRFGTTEALMLLPYWSGGCIGSMEGLLFESSATTPYHFLNQAELSAGPSEPEVGLPYGSLDVTLGVQHLQLLGVKYFIAETPQVEQEAAVDPSLQLVAKTGPWTYNYAGANTTTT